jgi:hypothetical protein
LYIAGRFLRAFRRGQVVDCGTGYSSLSHLSHRPIDKLKVDQSLVRNMEFGEREPCGHASSRGAPYRPSGAGIFSMTLGPVSGSNRCSNKKRRHGRLLLLEQSLPPHQAANAFSSN